MREAEAEGLVKIEGDIVHASFGEMEVPVGFEPTTEEGIMERAIRLVTSQTGMSRKEVISMANERQSSLSGLVDMDAVVLLVARELGLDVSTLAAEAYQNLISKEGS